MKNVSPSLLFDPTKPLNYDVVIFNHLMVFSQSLAYRQCDYEEMVRTLEGLVNPVMSSAEREVLRIFKQIMNELYNIAQAHYENKRRACNDEEELKRVEREEEDTMYKFRVSYYNLLFKWLVNCGCRVKKQGSTLYTKDDFLNDLKIELQSIFSVDVLEEVISKYACRCEEQ